MALPSLVDVLESLQPALPGQVAADLGRADDLELVTRVRRLAHDCVRALEAPALDATIADEVLVHVEVAELAAFREALWRTLDERLPALATAEARRLDAWFHAAQVALQRRDVAQLRQAEERFRMAIDRSSVSAFETDIEGRMTWLYNSVLQGRMGALHGRRINEMMSPEDSAALDEAQAKARLTGSRVVLHTRLYIGNQQVHRLLSYDVRRNAAGDPIGFAGTSVDTSAIRRVEEELSRAVAFREQLMAILGHDLRTPVSAVLGLAGLLLLDESLPPALREPLSRMQQAGRRMAELIATILDFARIRFHEALPITRSDMCLGELCRQVIDETLAGHPARRIELDECEDARGSWDRARLAQVVTNLLVNALTHGDPRSPVRLQLGGDARFVTLDVINRGAPIPEARVKQLFDPFVQGDGEDPLAPRRGLGLGLYIAKQIVDSHQGTLAAFSRDGETTFSLALRRHA
jgi:signal transduction histidine kinase